MTSDSLLEYAGNAARRPTTAPGASYAFAGVREEAWSAASRPTLKTRPTRSPPHSRLHAAAAAGAIGMGHRGGSGGYGGGGGARAHHGREHQDQHGGVAGVA